LYVTKIQDAMAEKMAEKFGVSKDVVPCRGCRKEDGCHFHIGGQCATLDCVKAKGVAYCHECADFPCPLLAPLADRANVFPHNMKVYNLGRIKSKGVDGFLEEVQEVRKRYFTLPLKVGKGQTD
jgi:hypothetical protein